ncbi:MAG: hypothetical protein ACRCVT_04675 [Leadbetterella sp.]
MKTLKVQNVEHIGYLIYGICIFPILLIGLSILFNENYLIGSLLTLIFYGIGGFFFFKKLNKEENLFEIIATNQSIIFQNEGEYSWNKIDHIESYSEIKYFLGRARYKNYIVFHLKNGNYIELDASNFDLSYKEIERDLNKFLEFSNFSGSSL